MDYGRQIYNTLQDILSFIKNWKTDLDAWQAFLETFLENSFNLFFGVVCIIAVVVCVSLAVRLFFPDYRD